jgi:signal transduction histidine kinase
VLDNAIRYNRQGGEVLLFARWQSDQLEIIVADNGPGIGGKSDAATGSVTQGLGLPLAKQLIESHGGTLTLESEAGQGTTVIMSLQCA